jgi:hypothetical protein
MADRLPHGSSTEEEVANPAKRPESSLAKQYLTQLKEAPIPPEKNPVKSGYRLGDTRYPPGLSVVKICIPDIHPIHKGKDMLLTVTHLDYFGSEKSHPLPTRVPKQFG